MKRRLPILLLVACAAGFACGLFQLFRLRFAVGDVYPEYSSLRSDPLGTMALYESLQRMPVLTVRRDFSTGNHLPDGKNIAYLHLAGSQWDWTGLPEDLVMDIERFLARGGRLAVTFYPETSKPRRPYLDEEQSTPGEFPKKRSKGQRAKAAEKKHAKQEPSPRRTPLKKWWGVEFAFAPLETGESNTYEPAVVVRKADLPLPDALAWHSGAVFTNLDKSWRTIYARGVHPVVIVCKFGTGTVVLATDSYFLSNEALRKDRQPELLAWLVGPAREVVFDEAHFGIVDTAGVASLVRKYRLHGLAIGLLLLAGLFLWQHAVSFVPPPPEEIAPGFVAGKDAAAGFVNLLRRNVPPRDVLKTCLSVWKKSLTHGGGPSASRVIQAEALLDADSARPQRQRDPVRTYQEICRILKADKPHPSPLKGTYEH